MSKNHSTDLVASIIGQGNAKQFVIRYYGDSMCPELKPGDLLLCRKLSIARDINSYVWGHIYLFATEQGYIVGRVNPGSTESTITINQENPLYGKIEIPFGYIDEAALLIGKVTEYAY